LAPPAGTPAVRPPWGRKMNALKISAIVLIVAGILGLADGSFSYTKQTHDIKS